MSFFSKLKKKIVRRFKKIAVFFVCCRFPGFTVESAGIWVSRLFRDMLYNKQYSLRKKIWAYRRGFLPSVIERFNLDKKNYKSYISQRNFYYLNSINAKYKKWMRDSLLMRVILKPFSDNIPKFYYQFYKRDEDIKITSLIDCPGNYGDSFDEVFRFIREKKRVNLYREGAEKSRVISYSKGKYYINAEECEPEKLVNILSKSKRIKFLLETVEQHKDLQEISKNKTDTLRLTMINKDGNHPRICEATFVMPFKIKESIESDESDLSENTKKEHDHVPDEQLDEQLDEIFESKHISFSVDIETGKLSNATLVEKGNMTPCDKHPLTGKKFLEFLPNWELIKEQIVKIGKYIPLIEFISFEIIITDNGFKIRRFVDHPRYSNIRKLNPETLQYLMDKVKQKKDNEKGFGKFLQRFYERIHFYKRKILIALFYPKGTIWLSAKMWFLELCEDLFTSKEVKFKQKIWAYRNGFLSYRIPQYGITKENRPQIFSDFEFRWIRHINNSYKNWLEDKITLKYVASDYSECFPSYYYYICYKNGANTIIPLLDCPQGYTSSYDDIFRLVEEKGILALKPDKGCQGKGFYQFVFKDGEYYLNHEKAKKEEIMAIFNDPSDNYLVTEYINMHSQLKEIYSGAVNTIRLIVFKKDGKTPTIGNAYFRFGSKKTGAVDNMGAGGMFAQLDIDTGRYYNAKIISENAIYPCPNHPDTGTKIEGIVPNWEKAKNYVMEISRILPQLEYLGFDLAITEDGIKIPEINRAPSYPKIEVLSPITMDYFFYKLDKKKERYGYDKKRPHKLFNLPKR